jgi:hypothetical protein
MKKEMNWNNDCIFENGTLEMILLIDANDDDILALQRLNITSNQNNF